MNSITTDKLIETIITANGKYPLEKVDMTHYLDPPLHQSSNALEWVSELGRNWRLLSQLTEWKARSGIGPSVPVWPETQLTFSAFNEVGPRDVRLLILGQDPYHSPGKARGVAFGYHPDYTGPINSSLRNIIQECGGDVDTFDTSLRHWTSQGVMLLNTELTVEEEKPLSHAGMWAPVVTPVLEYLASRDIPALAWGAHARKALTDAGFRRIISTSHPCSYSASKGSKYAPAFLGSGCFDEVNKLLEKPIDWTGGVS